MASFTRAHVKNWDVESVSGWLRLLGHADLIESFRENDINGVVLLDLDEELLGDMGVPSERRGAILSAVATIKEESSDGEASPDNWDSDSDEEGAPAPATPTSPSVPKPAPTTSPTKKAKRPSGGVVDKKKDPLRLAAGSKAVADLENSTVISGFLWKIGGSGLKPKHWKRRFFVLTDDNCLYYFKSPKDVAALGMILLPSYTITTATKSESVGGRQHAFKAFNREHGDARKYIFAAETLEEMKTWMNVLSLASIALGSGQASLAKPTKAPQELVTDDSDLQLMKQRAADRAGGVVGHEPTAPPPQAAMPAFLKKTSGLKKKGGPTLCLVKMLDGNTLQLYAEQSTTGQQFMDQVCAMLQAFEKYYFGLSFIDIKGDEDWLKLDKKVLKHDWPKDLDHYELAFRIQYYPMDVTQVLQYITLYQTFLSTQRDVLEGRLDISNKDALLLAALSFQAQRGDYNAPVHTPQLLATQHFLPVRVQTDIKKPAGLKPAELGTFLADEVIRVWKTLQGILKHLAVLKYMQLAQKHRNFALQLFEVKNKKGTPLTMGVNPFGLRVFRHGNLTVPIVKFSWAECSELSFAEKKFTIEVHDKETKAFSVYTQRSKTCQQILHLCIGLHRLYVQTVQNWVGAPEDLSAMRALAVNAALVEREELKKEAMEVRRKAKELRQKSQPDAAERNPAEAAAAAGAPTMKPSAAPTGPPPANPPKGPPTSPPPAMPPPAKPVEQPEVKNTAAAAVEETTLQAPDGEKVVVKGRQQAVHLLDIMMADKEFMEFQDELLAQMEAELGDDYDEYMAQAEGGQDVEEEEPEEDQRRWRCSSTSVKDRVNWVAELDHVRS